MIGAKTPGSGRKRGTPNKMSRAAQDYLWDEGPGFLDRLLELSRDQTLRAEHADIYLKANELGAAYVYGRPSRDVFMQVRHTLRLETLSDDELAARAEQIARAIRNRELPPAVLDGEVE